MIILPHWAENMLIDQGSRNGGNQSRVRATLVLFGLFVFLAARNVPPEFTRPCSLHAAIYADWNHHGSKHDQRPRFDNDGPQWSAPVGSVLLVPPTGESTQFAVGAEALCTRQAKGFHYNRPPPAS
jgi:hypothetical protein